MEMSFPSVSGTIRSSSADGGGGGASRKGAREKMGDKNLKNGRAGERGAGRQRNLAFYIKLTLPVAKDNVVDDCQRIPLTPYPPFFFLDTFWTAKGGKNAGGKMTGMAKKMPAKFVVGIRARCSLFFSPLVNRGLSESFCDSKSKRIVRIGAISK